MSISSPKGLSEQFASNSVFGMRAVEGPLSAVHYFKVHNFLGVFIAAILEG